MSLGETPQHNTRLELPGGMLLLIEAAKLLNSLPRIDLGRAPGRVTGPTLPVPAST